MNFIGRRFLINILDSFWDMLSALLTSQLGYTIIAIMGFMVVCVFLSRFVNWRS